MVRNRSTDGQATTGALGPDTPPSNVLFEIWLVSRAATGMLDAALAPAGLTADEFAIYSVIAHSPITPTALSRWMSAPLTTVSSYVKRFEGRGHVVRERSPGDRRSYNLRLTEEGRRQHQRAADSFQATLDSVESALGGSCDPVRHSLASLHDVLIGLNR